MTSSDLTQAADEKREKAQRAALPYNVNSPYRPYNRPWAGKSDQDHDGNDGGCRVCFHEHCVVQSTVRSGIHVLLLCSRLQCR